MAQQVKNTNIIWRQYFIKFYHRERVLLIKGQQRRNVQNLWDKSNKPSNTNSFFNKNAVVIEKLSPGVSSSTGLKERLSPNNYTPIRQKQSLLVEFIRLIKAYRDLSKAKLAALVILTTMCGYAMAPMATDLTCLFATTTGTGLCVASANAINQLLEIPYDAQMSRTRNRVLVRNAISPIHALSFGTLTGMAGVGILSTMVNPLTAILGASNILLYTCIYTPMKRKTIANTWIGAIVGAIPPMMGWAACTNNLELGAWILGGILYAWQFPHFNALAWNMRSDYSKAGYRMMVITNPLLNSRVSLRYTLALFPLSYITPYIGMTTWWFALDSSLINCVLLFSAYKFWKDSNDKSARDLFFASLVHLPVILALMMAHKKDQGIIINNEIIDVDEKELEKVMLELES
ncbi:33497_t:CDS:1 [Gigaspora margarita]|uniref:Protoheme IX farnesyltransferase, mitochondrial n=1 Tax=Gigaspora margarita TaxID=4874 RepID=A0ABN7V279_GIGMA|nr:33497_t:CDS:1 [Gigaspora margarita]